MLVYFNRVGVIELTCHFLGVYVRAAAQSAKRLDEVENKSEGVVINKDALSQSYHLKQLSQSQGGMATIAQRTDRRFFREVVLLFGRSRAAQSEHTAPQTCSQRQKYKNKTSIRHYFSYYCI